MKQIVFLSFCLLTISCKKEETKEPLYPDTQTRQNPVQLGQELFEGAGNCYACHQPDQKIIGPSIQEIAKIYKEKNGDMVSFLKGNGEPLVDPSQYETMKTNFAITKKMSDEELKALEAYMYSFLK